MSHPARKFFLLVLVVLVAMAAFAPMPSSQAAPTVPTHSPLIVGGDCSADRATGDLYVEPDGYCMTSNDLPAQQPAIVDKKIDDHETTTVTVQPQPKPQPEPEPPTAPVCKNKNSGKDGSPAECNAGKGNG